MLAALTAANTTAQIILRASDARVMWHNAAAERLLELIDAQALVSAPQPAPRGLVEYVVDGATHFFKVATRAHGEFVVAEFIDHTATETRFREMLDGIEAGVVLLSPILDEHGTVIDAEVLWANRASEAMWTVQDCLQPGTRITTSYYDVDEWLESANVAWTVGSSRRMLSPHPTRSPWDAAMEITRRIGDMFIEFTVDRSADEAILTQLDELDHRFAALIEELPLTVVVARLDSEELEFLSPNVVELTGYPLSELRTRADLARHVHPDDLPADDAIAAWLDRNGGHFEGQWRVTRADGQQILCNVRSVRRVGPTGVDGIIALVSDITGQRRLLDQAESSERLRSLGRTAGSIAHDFNNLLMIVSGNIERAQHQSAVELPSLSTAAAAAQRAGDLAQSLLAFARGRPGSPRLVDVASVVRQGEPILRATASSHTTLLVTADENLPQVFTDPTHLEQILLNLITNARDAIESNGTIAVDVMLATASRCHLLDVDAGVPQQAWVALSVTDTGCGIPRDLQATVWEPYYSSKEVSRDRGSGLGLSTVHGLVHQYGGHVFLESEPGRGTTVVVYLPAAPR